MQTWDKLIFAAYSTGLRRPYGKKEEPDSPNNVMKVMVCRFRKELAKLTQKVQLETRWGQGLILISNVDEIVLEVA